MSPSCICQVCPAPGGPATQSPDGEARQGRCEPAIPAVPALRLRADRGDEEGRDHRPSIGSRPPLRPKTMSVAEGRLAPAQIHRCDTPLPWPMPSGITRWCQHRQAQISRRGREAVVVADEGGQLVSQLEGRREVDGIERAQGWRDSARLRGRRFERRSQTRQRLEHGGHARACSGANPGDGARDLDGGKDARRERAGRS